MKIIFTTCFFFLACASSFSQLVLTGAGTSTSVANNAPAVTVDNSLTITGSGTISTALISVSANFSAGDVLAYTGALPSGVTAAYNSGTGVLTFTGSATPAQYQALLRTVTFASSSASTTQRTVTFNLGSAISFSGNGHFYEFVSGSFSWSSAKTDADSKTFYGLHGYLATITSQAENDFIQQKIGADAWIGASDEYTHINAATGATTYANQAAAEGKWYWVTGPAGEKGVQFSNGNTSPAAVGGRYMNWNTNEPNNSGSNEHYAEIYSSGSAGKWNDLGASSLGYVVEYGGLAGDPSVSLSASRNIVMIATSLQTTGSSNPYALHGAAKYVDNAVTVYSTGNITDAKVTIGSNFNSGDVLSYTGGLPSGVTAAYNATTGVLSFTGTATASQWQALFRTVQFNSSSNIIGNRMINFSVGNLVSGNNGHFYEYVSTTGSWTTAKTNAAARTYLGLHGYLATITSQTENDFIKQKIGADAWIGASDDYTHINSATGTSTYANQATAEGKWYWVTGPAGEIGVQFSNGNTTPAVVGGGYMNWNTNEPNNSSSNEHYGEIFASGANPGRWNDLPNTSTLGYVVEYGGLTTDPLLYLSASRTMAVSTILPVTGLQFTATRENKEVLLKWSTMMEINTSHFMILHSTDGINYTSIGEMPAAGNSDQPVSYQWKHTRPADGSNYYQLKQVDKDDRFTFSVVRQVSGGKNGISVSPNPAQTQIVISYPYTGRPTELIIRNSAGAIVHRESVSSYQSVIQISKLPAGFYFVETGGGNDKSRCSFIKQ